MRGGLSVYIWISNATCTFWTEKVLSHLKIIQSELHVSFHKIRWGAWSRVVGFTVTNNSWSIQYTVSMSIKLLFGIGLSWACSLVLTTSRGVTAKEKNNQIIPVVLDFMCGINFNYSLTLTNQLAQGYTNKSYTEIDSTYLHTWDCVILFS